MAGFYVHPRRPDQIEFLNRQVRTPYVETYLGNHDFNYFGIVFGGLTLLPEGPRTLRECPEGPGTL